MAKKWWRFKKIKLGKYFFEFASVFFAVIAAFALNNWNENRRDAKAEEKILLEIRNGLIADLKDVEENKTAHEDGLRSCDFFNRLIKGKAVPKDSVETSYLYLTLNLTSTMNTSGYESLKSKGLELINNDSIRIKIIELYELYYQRLIKVEEDNPSTQIFENFYMPINRVLSPNMTFNNNTLKIEEELNLSAEEKKIMNSYLWRIRRNREAIIYFYDTTEEKIKELLTTIEKELDLD